RVSKKPSNGSDSYEKAVRK
ncbi:histidine kinase-, DNA gyrase B-, and HSP90-like ATPase family protein, partial [Chlamydia psittaci 08-2626_L3]